MHIFVSVRRAIEGASGTVTWLTYGDINCGSVNTKALEALWKESRHKGD